MNISRFFLLLVLPVLLWSSACLGGRNGDMIANGTLECQVNGTPWEGDFIAMASLSGDASREVLTITGQQDSDNSQVQVILNPFTGPGTYTIVEGDFSETDQGRYTGSNALTQTFTTMSGLGEGTIEVTEFSADGQAQGTFSFTAVNATSGNEEVEITQGTFDLEVTDDR